MKPVSLCIIFIMQSLCIFADDGSARCYAALQREPVICKYFLLSTKPVQENIHITKNQINSLKLAMVGSLDMVPGMTEYRRLQKQLLAAASSDEERAKIRQSGNEKAHFLIRQNWEAILKKTLDLNQAERLGQLFLQMMGPNAILEETNASGKLALTKRQTTEMIEVSDSHRQLLSLLHQRLLGLQIQPERKRDPADVDLEIKSLFCVIREVQRDQDSELLAVLDSDQRRLWTEICGTRVNIDWGIECFADMPFQD